MHRLRLAARAGRRRHGHTHGLRRRLRLHHARADRGRRQGQGLNPRHPPHRDASRHARPRRSAHARRQRPRARQGPRPGCRRADPGPGGRGRARRQATGARAGGGRLAGRRLRPTRMRGAHQRAGHAVGTGRRARPRRRRRRRRAAAQGRKPGPAGRAGAGIERGRRAADLPLWAMCETPLGFLRLDAIAGHPRLAALVVARRTWSGSACAPHAGPRGNAAGAFAGHHGRPRPRTGGVGWRAPGPGR